MNTLEHLTKILPASGLKVLAVMKPRTDVDGNELLKPDGSKQLTTWHKTFSTVEELAKAVRLQSNSGQTIYMAMAGFDEERSMVDKVSKTGKPYKGFSRQADFTTAFKAIWLDIDVGQSKADKGEGYANQELALDALRDFVNELTLPQPMLVNSGGGVHAYWAFTEDLDSASWFKLAKVFDACIKHYGLLADPSCTADRARILRPIGTINYKYNRPVSLIEDAPSISSRTFIDAIKPYYKAHKNEIEALKIKTVEYKKKDAQDYPSRPHHAKYFLKRCQVGNYTLTGNEPVSEPVWRGVMSVLRLCDNGHKHIETLRSKCKARFPETTRFDEDRTAEKLQWLESHDFGAFLCDTFKKECSHLCEGCPYANGLTIKSPLSLAVHYDEIEMPQLDIDISELYDVKPKTNKRDETELGTSKASNDGIGGDENGVKRNTTTPQPPYPYRRTAHGLAKVDGEQEKIFFKGDLYPLMTRFVEVVDGERQLMLKFMLRIGDGGKYHEVSFLMRDWYAQDRIKQKLGSTGVSIPEERMKDLLLYMRKYVEHVESDMDEIKQLQHFGWVDERQEFLLGDKLYREDGVVTVQPHFNIKNYVRYFRQSGSIVEWKKLMQRLADLGAVEQQICMLSSFGATLMRFTNYNGVWLHLMTKPGYGKTTTQEMMNGIWGHPQDLLLNAKDTINAIEERFGRWSSLGVAIDEVSNLDPMVASELLLGVTQGRTKQRLDTNMRERVNELTWQLLVLSSGNFSLIDRINTRKEDVAAEISRTLEFKLPKPTLSVHEGETLIKKPIRENYGVAGEVWLTNLVKIPHYQIQALIDQTTESFSRTLNATSDERFWVAGCAVMYVAGVLTNKIGLTNWNLDQIFTKLCDVVKTNRSNRVTFDFSATDVLGSFLADNTRNTVVTDVGVTDDTTMLRLSPSGTLNVRYEQDTGLIYIRTQALKEYCAKRGIGIQSVKESLEIRGLLHNHNHRMIMSKGLPYSTGRTYCIVVKVDDLMRAALDVMVENANEPME